MQSSTGQCVCLLGAYGAGAPPKRTAESGTFIHHIRTCGMRVPEGMREPAQGLFVVRLNQRATLLLAGYTSAAHAADRNGVGGCFLCDGCDRAAYVSSRDG